MKARLCFLPFQEVVPLCGQPAALLAWGCAGAAFVQMKAFCGFAISKCHSYFKDIAWEDVE